MVSSNLSVTLSGAALIAAQAAAQPCDPHWSDEFPYGGIDGIVYALAVADLQGPGGPVLVAGFDGTSAGGLPANHIAQWDGHRWSPLGAGLDGPSSPVVRALAVFDEDGDGPKPPALFAGGIFTNSGGQPMSGIARWDGQSWSPVGGGIAGTDKPAVNALCVIDEDGPGPGRPALMVGGSFTQVGIDEAHFIARWDGSAWSGLGSGLDKPVAAFAIFDDDGPGPHLPALFAGGDFQFAGGKQVNRLAKWNGQAWEKWESGITGAVTSLAVMDDDGDGPHHPALYVGGKFHEIGGLPFGGIGRWNGYSWNDLGCTSSAINALYTFDLDGDGPQPSSLFVGGSLTTAGGFEAQGIARWDGQNWSDADGPTGSIYAFAAFDPDGPGPTPLLLHGAGGLKAAGRALPTGIAALVNGKWTSLGAGFDGLGPAHLLSVQDDLAGPALYASGYFGTVDGVPADHVARWDGHTWSGLNGGIEWRDDVVISFFDPDGDGPHSPDLYAGGSYKVGNQVYDVLARWSGKAWDEVASLPDGRAYALLQFDEDSDGPIPPALFVAGSFTTQVKRWDGQSLSDVGGGLKDGAVHALTAFDPDGPGSQPTLLIAGGTFKVVHGAPASYIASWNGSIWSPIGYDIDIGGPVNDLRVIDADGPGLQPPTLYAAGGVLTSLAYWAGTQWLFIGNDQSSTVIGFDPDGAGLARTDLYTGGTSIFRRGKTWVTVAGGTNGPVSALAVYDDGNGPALYIAGGFKNAGGQSAGHFARLDCPAKSCYADCTLDGTLDLFDYTCFLNLFNTADPAADCDSSGALDLFDFLCFANLFNAGCP